MDTNTINAVLTALALSKAQPDAMSTNTIVMVVGMVIGALPAIGTLILAIKTAGTVKQIEVSTNSAASAMTTKLDKSNEAILRMSQELATIKAEHAGQALAAATAATSPNVREIIREEMSDKRNL